VNILKAPGRGPDVHDGFVHPFMRGASRRPPAYFTLLDYSVLTGEPRTHRATVARSRICVTVWDYWHGMDLPVTSRHFTLRPGRAQRRIALDMEGQGWIRLESLPAGGQR
jgi:hypothetical protein